MAINTRRHRRWRTRSGWRLRGGDGTNGDRPLDGTDDGFGSRRDDERKGPRFSSLGESRNAQPENSKILPAVPYGNDSILRARRFRSNADDACRNVYLVLVTEEMSHPATSLSKEEAPSNHFAYSSRRRCSTSKCHNRTRMQTGTCLP